MKYDVIIIGAGASGLVAAISAARQGSSVLVIEKKDAAGKKILATGNGKCNYTNMVQKQECFRSDDTAFVMKLLSGFNVYQTIQFFKEIGIYPKERDGYLYPNSEQASSIVKVLVMECERLKVHFAYNETVKEIKEPLYTVITEAIKYKEISKKAITKANKEKETIIKKNIYYAGKLILATGGCASPKLGSDGSGFKLARNFGHTIIKPLPALVQLKSPDKFCKTISGVRTDAIVNVYTGSKQLAHEAGEILFTDYGISGIPILQISRFASKALDSNEKVFLKLDLLPLMSKSELTAHLRERIKNNPGRNIEEMMVGLLNHKLSYCLIKETKLDPYNSSEQMNEQELKALVESIKEFVMNINDTNSFDNAQVCAGGVATVDIDDTSMESKIIKGLYFAGEVVDVDGTCGGYNLQWAWSSGYLAGKSAGKASKGYEI